MIDPEFGYYLCNGLKFQKKIEALIYSKTNNKPVEWYFQDHLYSNYPWHIEPEETLDQLYDKRARELREKYDYLVLCFSGGSDSFNILESFIRQKLHLDEIVTTHTSYADKTVSILNPNIKDNWNYSAEHELNALPRLKYAYEKLPNTKITIFDETEGLFNSFKEYETEDWVLKRTDHLGAIQPLKYNLFDIKKLRTEFDKNKSIAIIWGRDKPKTSVISNKFYTRFNDVTLNLTQMLNHNKEYTNLKIESFYWNSSCLPMLCKQAHVIKKWLESTPSVQTFWLNNSMTVSRQIHEKLIRNVIYTTWNENWFQVEKPNRQWFTQWDEWFRKDPNFTKQLTDWKRGIDYAVSILPEYINMEDGIPNDFKIYSKSYLISPINIKQSF